MLKSLVMLNFLKEVRTELARVSFPSKSEVIRLTIVVIALSALVGLLISFSDLIFLKLINLIV